MRSRTVVIQYAINVCIEVPEDWTPELIEAHRNAGHWCFNNVFSELERLSEDSCLCGSATAKYIKEADEEDEELWDMNRDLSDK